MGNPRLCAAGRSGAECPLSRLGGIGPASHRTTPCQNFVAAAAKRSEPGQQAGGRGAGPGQAGRGAPRAAAPARGPTMPQLGGGRGGGAGGGGGGSGAGATSGGDDLGANDELIPFQDEGGEEQEPSSDSASAQRDLDEVKSSLVNESENQSSSSDSEVKGFLGSAPRGTRVPLPLTRGPRLCVSSTGGEAPAAYPGRFPEAARLFCRRYVPSPAVSTLWPAAIGSTGPHDSGGRARVLLPSLQQLLWGSLEGNSGSRFPPGVPDPCAVWGTPDLTPIWFLSAVRRPQDGAFFKGPAYPGYPFLMIPDLSSPYLSNGPLSPGGARTVSVRPAVPGPVGAGLGGMRPQARPWCGGWGLLRRSWAELVCGVKLPCGGLV